MSRSQLPDRARVSPLFITFGIGAVTVMLTAAAWFCGPHSRNKPAPAVRVVSIGEQQYLMVEPIPHSPLAQSHITSIRVEPTRQRIEISEWDIVWNPFSESLNARHDVLLRLPYPEGEWKVYYGTGSNRRVIAVVAIGDSGKLELQTTLGDVEP